jgi:hypothetical protein
MFLVKNGRRRVEAALCRAAKAEKPPQSADENVS